MRFCLAFAPFVLILSTAAAQPAASEPADDGPVMPSFTAKLYAANAAIAPGGKSELAIEVSVEKDWHIYHPILLSAGLPTEFTFETPAGLSVGEVLYPTPKLKKFGEADYLGYEKRVVFLAPLSAAADLKPQEAGIKVEIRALACNDERGCVPVSTEAVLNLPVTSSMGAAENEKLFAAARRNLPPALANAPYLTGSSLAAKTTSIAIGGKGELMAELKIAKGHHIQDPDPGLDGLIGSRFFIEAIDGVKVGEARWPAPRIHDAGELGKVREQAGNVAVRIPIEITDKKFKPGPVTLRVLFRYQACKDGGECYPPEMAEARVGFEVTAGGAGGVAATGAEREASANSGPGKGGEPLSLPLVFLFALLGGAILNVMPCVLPVLSLKIFSFMQQAQDEPGRVFRMGLIYAAGILTSFVPLAIVMVNYGLAWGGLMQQPVYVIGMAAVVFAFGLSLLGVFELRLPGVVEDVAGAVTTREGYGGAFLNGIMATALATPCVGPLLGTAVGILVQLPPLVAGAGIMTVGVGLALPYVLLTAFPRWMRLMPKPGHWMVTFKQVMGFVLMVTLVWLMWVLQYLVTPVELIATLTLLVGVGFGCWMIGKISLSASRTRVLAAWATAAAAMFAGWAIGFRWLARDADSAGVNGKATAIVASHSGCLEWRDWTPALPYELASQGKTVYVDFTAKWCLTCQTNKKVVLETQSVCERVHEMNVVMLHADFTRYDPEIQKELRRYSRAGVPLNLILPAGKPDEPIILPEVLTQGAVLDALAKAGPSKNDAEIAQK